MKKFSHITVLVTMVLVLGMGFAFIHPPRDSSGSPDEVIIEANEQKSENLENQERITVKKSAFNPYPMVWDSGTTILEDYVYCITVGDQDGDGEMEIIAGSGPEDGPGNVSVFEHDGTDDGYEKVWDSGETFDQAVDSVTVGDQDGDGKKEIIAGSYDGNVTVFEHDGTDDGYEKVWDSGTSIGGSVFDVAVGDQDSDGKKEIIVGSNDGNVTVFEHDGTDDGYEKVWDSGTVIGSGVSSVAIGDQDGDGKKEIIVGAHDGHLYVFEHDGTDDGYQMVWDNKDVISDNVKSITVGDQDGDGEKEIIAGSWDNKVHVFEHDGTDDGYEKVWDSGTLITMDVDSVTVGDQDGDGKKEIIAGSYNHHLYVFEHDGTDDGYEKVWDNGETFGNGVSSVAIGDQDGDGKKEIIAGSYDGKVYVFEYDNSRELALWARIVDKMFREGFARRFGEHFTERMIKKVADKLNITREEAKLFLS